MKESHEMQQYDESRMEHMGGKRPVAFMDVGTRADFLTKTYSHLLGGIVAFTLLEIALFKSGIADKLAGAMFGSSWLLWLGGFMIVGFLASRLAFSTASRGVQYAGLAFYIAAQAIIFVPLLFIAQHYAPGAIQSAALVTLAGFTVLTMIVFYTKKDFSFLRGILIWGGFAALGFIVVGTIAGFSGGNVFPVLMIAFAGAAVLYDTSNVLHHFPEDRYVGASLQLFASIALMFWYVLILFLNSRD
jgi:hypothetical protein